jgi:hypothetical protein
MYLNTVKGLGLT